MWGLHNRLRNIFQFTIPVSGSQFSGSQAVFSEVSGTTARFDSYSGPTGGSANFASASIGYLESQNAQLTGSLFGTASFANMASGTLTPNNAFTQSVLLAGSVGSPAFTYTTAVSASLTPGVWLINAQAVMLGNTTATVRYYARIRNLTSGNNHAVGYALTDGVARPMAMIGLNTIVDLRAETGSVVVGLQATTDNVFSIQILSELDTTPPNSLGGSRVTFFNATRLA